MSKTKISARNQNLLWAISGGRCEFEGCNKPLYKDILTKKGCNNAYIAHIVADSPDGPRGDVERSPLLADDINNLMLMCDSHHRLIDNEAEEYPEYRLLEMKRKHEDRIARVTAISPNMGTNIILYGANIGQHAAALSYDGACEALGEDYYPAEDHPIEIGLKNYEGRDNSDRYWGTEEDNLCTHMEKQVLSHIRNGESMHYSVFALAPQPLLIKLGTLLNDMHNVRVYQKHREPNTWRWLNDSETLQYELRTPENYDGIPVMVIGLSATITHDRIIAVLGGDVSIWHISIPSPNNDCMKNEQSLVEFGRCIRRAMDTIKAHHGCRELHIFSAMPVSAAIELGRVWMPKADMPLVIYDQNKDRGGFYKTITIE